MSVLWSIAPGQQLAAWGWDDEFVLYNNLSGDTHLLDGNSVALLAQLQQAAATVPTLVAAFSDGADPEEAAALSLTVAEMLSSLQNLFLIESRSVSPGSSC